MKHCVGRRLGLLYIDLQSALDGYDTGLKKKGFLDMDAPVCCTPLRLPAAKAGRDVVEDSLSLTTSSSDN